MKVQVLGSAGSEGPGVYPPAYLIDDFILLDAGTVNPFLDSQAQCRITHIFLTHAHFDHIKGIPFLVDNLVAVNQRCQIAILSGADVLSDLRKNIFNNRIWPDFTTIPDSEHPVMVFREMSTREPVTVRGYRVHCVEVHHSVPAYGYLIEDPLGGTLVYTGDTGPTEAIWERMRDFNVKMLITEVSFPNEMSDLALASGHLTPDMLAQEIRKMPSVPEKICIAHLKPFYMREIVAQLTQIPGVNLEVLKEGKCFRI